MSKKPITSAGAEMLREQLRVLKTVERQKIINAVSEARAHGDLSENAEYHAAREQQSLLEGRIAALEAGLAEAQVVDISKLDVGDSVVFGANVELLGVADGKVVSYQIVGELEADIDARLISVHSPIARALIGKHVGDTVEVTAPKGPVEYEIIKICYAG